MAIKNKNRNRRILLSGIHQPSDKIIYKFINMPNVSVHNDVDIIQLYVLFRQILNIFDSIQKHYFLNNQDHCCYE